MRPRSPGSIAAALSRSRAVLAATAACVVAGCGEGAAPPPPPPSPSHAAEPTARATANAASPGPAHISIYAHDRAGMLAPAVRHDRPLVYVPNSISNTVDVVDQRSGRIVEHFAVPAEPQHVVPSWDLRTLWVASDQGNALVPIDPRTGRHGRPVHVEDPYNLYFTPDGRRAIVVAERLQRLDFRTPHRMRLRRSLNVSCPGIDHLDFTADGRRLIASCEFSGRMVEVDVRRRRVVRYIPLKPGAMPQDVRLSPDGRTFFVADMASGGVWKIDAQRMKPDGFIPTGLGAHGIYPSRSGTRLFVSNRAEGTISVLQADTGQVLRKWQLPGGGSPDMGGVSASGRALWLTGRYNSELYEISTRSGRLIRRIPVGAGPHGAAVWPQPGRYSLGHTGNMR